jgi:hypothetical protein
MSVSVTTPTNCLPFFTKREPTRAARIVLAALAIDVFGPTLLGFLFMIFATVDMLMLLSTLNNE